MNKKIIPYTLYYYDKEVIKLICEKYCEALDNAFCDIDSLVEERKKALLNIRKAVL